MTRDGFNRSLWQETEGLRAARGEADTSKVYDVVVVGGGITGLTTALLMQEHGLRCLLAEAQTIGFGTTGGTTAHLNTILDTPYYEIKDNFDVNTARMVARGARVAIDLIEAYSMKHKIPCELKYKTAYLFSETEEEAKELLKIKDATEESGIVTEWATGIPVPIPFKTAIAVGRQAQFHPTKYIAGLAKAFISAGGVLVENCSVTRGGETDKNQVTVQTETGEILAHRLVYATHIPPGINSFSFRCAPYRSYAIALTLKEDIYPDGLVYDMKDPYHYFRTHTTNGETYLIAGGGDHKTGHNENTGHVFTELEAYVRHYFPVDSVAYRWSSQYYIPADGLPYIGLMPGHSNTYIATGFNGNGMVFGTLAAIIISSLIEGKPTVYADTFSPSRIKPVAGFANFVKENADVVRQFVGKRLSYERISSLTDVAPGQAVVTNWEGQKIALFRDDHGKLIAVDPVCPHAGCIVSWNDTERTWDCPCHGARYAPDGTMLTGPAQQGLQQLQWEEDTLKTAPKS